MLESPLTEVEARVLGSLIEKEATTPDAYPLSINALMLACNQTSNRDPIMRLDEDAVTIAAVALRRRGLLRAIQPVGSRVTKYEHLLADVLTLGRRELAVLGVLLLRGAQTAGELHARTARLAEFEDLADLERAIEALIAHTPEALVVRLARRPGQKEVRYAQLLGGERAAEGGTTDRGTVEGGTAEGDRVAALERTVSELRDEVAALRAELAEFRAQFQ